MLTLTCYFPSNCSKCLNYENLFVNPIILCKIIQLILVSKSGSYFWLRCFDLNKRQTWWDIHKCKSLHICHSTSAYCSPHGLTRQWEITAHCHLFTVSSLKRNTYELWLSWPRRSLSVTLTLKKFSHDSNCECISFTLLHASLALRPSWEKTVFEV